MRHCFNWSICTSWKVSKYGAFSGPFFLYSESPYLIRIYGITDQKKLRMSKISQQCWIQIVQRLEVFCRQAVLKNFAKFAVKHLWQSPFLLKTQASVCIFINKETLAQAFSCELCKIAKEHLRKTASELSLFRSVTRISTII